ncbi:hypothetical protein F2Q69_00010715 [Brassica cretica]|uniref:Uncharacterized protein n=1 Tax=Brassica cretica TaxID=69181 RepID=A0A8S9QVF4_BRACR|nr:hypothetical protein F2Q69_00010715 [Brassica cretica]
MLLVITPSDHDNLPRSASVTRLSSPPPWNQAFPSPDPPPSCSRSGRERDHSNIMGEKILTFRKSEMGEIEGGDRFCVSGQHPVWFTLKSHDEAT